MSDVSISLHTLQFKLSLLCTHEYNFSFIVKPKSKSQFSNHTLNPPQQPNFQQPNFQQFSRNLTKITRTVKISEKSPLYWLLPRVGLNLIGLSSSIWFSMNNTSHILFVSLLKCFYTWPNLFFKSMNLLLNLNWTCFDSIDIKSL